MHTLKKSTAAFSDALALLRVWANQRGYCGGGKALCIRGFEGRGAWWSGILKCVIEGEEGVGGRKEGKRRAVGRGLSSYQLFRAVLDFIGRRIYAHTLGNS
jgi:U3 small nucleolar RNA-associated protein 22